MLRFKGILQEINSLFDDQTQRGRRFQTLMSKLVEDVFLVFDIDKDKTRQAMENLLSLAGGAKSRSAAWPSGCVTTSAGRLLRASVATSAAALQPSSRAALSTLESRFLEKPSPVGMFDALLAARPEPSRERTQGREHLGGAEARQDPAQFQTDQSRRSPQPDRASLGRRRSPAAASGIPAAGRSRAWARRRPRMPGAAEVCPRWLCQRPRPSGRGRRAPRSSPAGRMGGISITGGVHLHLPRLDDQPHPNKTRNASGPR